MVKLVWCVFFSSSPFIVGEFWGGFLCSLLVRYVEGSVDKDAGAMIRDGIKVMEKMGVCPVP